MSFRLWASFGLSAGLLAGCDRPLPAEKFVAVYEQECAGKDTRLSYTFRAMAVTRDYYQAKWGEAMPDSALRVIFTIESAENADPAARLAEDPLFSALGQGEAAFKARARTFDSGLQGKIRLLLPSGDTLEPLSYRFMRNWGLTNVTSLVVLFPSSGGVQANGVLRVEDFGDWGGHVRLELPVCTELKLKGEE